MWFFFSIAACALPLLGIVLRMRRGIRNPWIFSLGSFLLYAAVCMDELFTIRRRALGGDWGGIEDTIGAVLFISGAVALAVLVLNVLLLGISYGEDK